MKKIMNIIVTLVVIMLISMLYITFNIDKNINFRYWLSEHFQKVEIENSAPEVYFLGLNDIYSDSSETIISNPNYINLDWLKEIDATYQYDTVEKILSLIWNGNQLVVNSSGSVTLNGLKKDEIIDIKTVGENVYISIEGLNRLEGFKQMGIHVTSDEDATLRVITLDAIQYQVRHMSHKSYLLKSVDLLEHSVLIKEYPTLTDIREVLRVVDVIKPEDELIAYAVNAKSALIYNGRTIGYGVLDKLEPSESENTYIYETDDFYPNKKLPKTPLFLVWEAVYSKNPNTDNIPQMNGVNIVSPTWIELKNSNGEVSDKTSTGYLNWSKSKQYDTWVLASNAFDPEITHEFLISYEGRQKFINELVSLCQKNSIDGINLDFENIYLKDKAILSHFVNELAWRCNQYDIVLSMDVTVMDGSDNWSKCYDRRMLGKSVDYLVIMTYDEYWASSPVSGPVSSYDWVERSLIKIIDEVPSHKLIMGLPFYTRVWTETLSSDASNKVNVSSKAIGMIAQNALIEEKALNPIWNEQEGLFYVSYIEENSIKKIWIENEVTLSKKASLVKQLGLKGIACWRRGFEELSVYDSLYNEIKE